MSEVEIHITEKELPFPKPPPENSNGNPDNDGHIPQDYQLDHITTDVGNAERFIRQYGQSVRYNSKRKMWLIWQRTHWDWDDNVRILSLAQRTARSIYSEAAIQEDPRYRRVLSDWAQSSESNVHLKAMVEQAKPRVVIELNELDQNGWLYNCANGTIDLHIGQLLAHRKEDMITVCVPITYDSTAQCPKWLAFLDYITDHDIELQTYLQKAVGYTLTADVKEQIFFDCYGELGNNGKTTFLTIVRSLVGDYGTPVPIDLFLHNTKSNAAQGHTESLANIQGKRFIIPSELERRAQLAMGLLKTLTGNDAIKASRKGEHEIDFVPICKIWIYGNYKPIVNETGNSFWRRLKLIPFNVTVPAEKIDKNLPADLQKELSGILNWAIDGCLAWQKEGFGKCDAVTDATEKYREESDELALFIADSCEIGVGKDFFATKKAMKDAYSQWCEDNGRYPMRASDFGHTLTGKGIIDGKRENQRGWLGIKITYSVYGKEDKADKKGSPESEMPEDEPNY